MKEFYIIQAKCLDISERLYLIDRHGWVDIYLRHMINDEEDGANMTVSIELIELERVIDELKKAITKEEKNL